MKQLFVISLIPFFFLSCSRDKEFQSELWINEGLEYKFENRLSMANDLLKNYELKGMAYSQIVGLLGNPESKEHIINADNSDIKYTLSVEWGAWHLYDPKIMQELIITFSPDSIVQNFYVRDHSNEKNLEE